MTEASSRTAVIVENITGVASAASTTSSGVAHTSMAIDELVDMAKGLDSIVKRFQY